MNKFQILHWIVELRIFRIKHKTVFQSYFPRIQIRCGATHLGMEEKVQASSGREPVNRFFLLLFLVCFVASFLGCEQLVSKDNLGNDTYLT